MACPSSPSARFRRRIARATLASSIALVLLPPAGAGAQTQQGGAKEKTSGVAQSITFVHEGCRVQGAECRLSYALTLKDRERFAVRITRTPLSLFDYAVAGVARGAPDTTAHLQSAELGDTTLLVTHEQRYGGYIVTLRRKPDQPDAAGFPEATLFVSVETERWQYEVGGGFPVSTLLNDRAYELRDTTIGDQPRSVVARDRGKESRVRMHTATFIHLFRTDSPLAWSFGLGIGDETAYFLGASYRFGSAGAFTIGGVLGSYQDLPKGVRVGDVTDDANALANLGRRSSAGLFLGFSFGFLGSNRSALEKPFKGEAPPPTPPAAAQVGVTPRRATPTADAPNELTVLDTIVAPGDSVRIRVTLVPPEGEELAPETYQIAMGSPFDTARVSVDFLLAADGKIAAVFRAHLSEDVKDETVVPSLTLEGGGVKTPIPIKGQAIRIRLPEAADSPAGG